jgi:WD40 repeat protein
MRLASIIFLMLGLMGVAHSDTIASSKVAHPELVLQRGHRYADLAAARFTDDGKTLVSVGYDGEVKEWNTATGAVLRSWTAGRSEYKGAIFSYDGKFLATCFRNGDYPARLHTARGQISLWNVATGQLLHSFQLDEARTGIYSLDSEVVLAFSHDGNYLAVITEWSNYHLTILDTRSGKVHLQIEGAMPHDTGGFLRVAFSPDDSLVATIAAHHQAPVPNDRFRRIPYEATATVQLWDAKSGELRRILPNSPATYLNGGFTNDLDIAFAPDGSTLSAVNRVEDAYSVPERKEHVSARSWSLASGELERELNWDAPVVPYSMGAALLARLLPDGQRLALLHNGKIEVWSLETGQIERTLTGLVPKAPARELFAPLHSNSVWALQYVEENDYPTPYFVAWNLQDGKLRGIWKREAVPLSPIAFSPDGKRLVGRFKDGVEILAAETGKVLVASHLLTGSGAAVWSVALDVHSQVLASAVESKVLLWNTTADKLKSIALGRADTHRTKTRNAPPPPIIKSLSFSSDGSLLAGGGGRDLERSPQGFVMVWNAATGTLKARFAERKPIITAVAFLPSGKTLAVGDGAGQVSLWNASNGQRERLVSRDKYSVTSLTVSTDGKTLAWGSHENFTKVWDLAAHKPLQELKPSYWGKAVAITPNGAIVAGVNECDIPLWSTSTGQLLHNLQAHILRLLSLAISPDGKILASGGYDGAVHLWDVASGEEKRVVLGHTGGVRSLVFSADGKLLVSGSDDGEIRFWNVVSGQLHLTILLPAQRSEEMDSSGGLRRTTLLGWIAYTPDGHYDGSPNIEKFIRWRVGDRLFPAQKFKTEMHRSDLIAQVLHTE